MLYFTCHTERVCLTQHLRGTSKSEQKRRKSTPQLIFFQLPYFQQNHMNKGGGIFAWDCSRFKSAVKFPTFLIPCSCGRQVVSAAGLSVMAHCVDAGTGR